MMAVSLPLMYSLSVHFEYGIADMTIQDLVIGKVSAVLIADVHVMYHFRFWTK